MMLNFRDELPLRKYALGILLASPREGFTNDAASFA
jgi:hypothetical protein